MSEHTIDENDTNTWYRLVLADDTGRKMAEALSPVLPRFIHIRGEDQRWEGSDDPEATTNGVEHVDSFARIGSAVWIEDDHKDALFVRVSA